MAVFRVERTQEYTVMSNHHLRDHDLSLKAKGLLSQMLSLPEDWDYTLAGLAKINRESVDAIRTAVQELEKAGYITRRQCRDEKGKLSGNEYTIYEQPQERPPEEDTPLADGESQQDPLLDFPTTDNPIPDNPLPEKPLSENPTQINKDITNNVNKKESKKKKSGADGPAVHGLDDDALDEDIIAWIGRAGEDLHWSREDKNAIYRAMKLFYAPRDGKHEPSRLASQVHTIQGRCLRFSEGEPRHIVDMLERAVTGLWTGVFDSKDYHAPAPKQTPTQGGDFEEW